jgi:hypothetical protein
MAKRRTRRAARQVFTLEETEETETRRAVRRQDDGDDEMIGVEMPAVRSVVVGPRMYEPTDSGGGGGDAYSCVDVFVFTA